MSVKLIDIHHAKDVYDLEATFEAGIEGLIHKASEGLWFTDPSMMSRMSIAWSIGFVPGAYHFYRSNLSGQEQAYYFLKALDPLRELTNGVLIPPWCDLETVDGVPDTIRMQQVLQFLRVVNTEYKCPGVYSSPGFWASHTTKPTWIKLYWQWLAQWTPAPTFNLPAGWSLARCKLWQRCIAGRYNWCVDHVPGIRGQVDINRFLGTLPELKAWAGYGEIIVPSASPSPSPDPDYYDQVLGLMIHAAGDLDAAIEITKAAQFND